MTDATLRVDPKDIPTTLKEAVVDSLVNLVHAQVSGAGSSGKHLYGARPRTVLNSAFLLPAQKETGGDEVTSPIWVSSHGMQLQLSSGVSAELSVTPQLSVYVRVLPNEADLIRPTCRPVFQLRREVSISLKEAYKAREDAEWEKIKGGYTARYQHPAWPKIREQLRDEIRTARGIPKNIRYLDSIGEDEEAPLLASEAPPVEGVTVDDSEAPAWRDDLYEPLVVPHKWLRLDIPLPELQIDPSLGTVDMAARTEAHAALMNQAITNYLEAWAQSMDPDMGGQAWGYRSLLTVRPSHYYKWSEFLDFARKSTATIALPKIQLAWNFQCAPDWGDPGKQNLLVALENISKDPPHQREETDHAVFLVSLTARVPEQLHKPLKLARIKPSYRYNSYLQYPAMGHNGGVQQVSATADSVILRTTWAPRYVQPRIVPSEIPSINRHVRSLSQPDGLEGILAIEAEMAKWLAQQPKKVNVAAGLESDDSSGLEREEDGFKYDQAQWLHELEAIKAGLAILQESRMNWQKRGPQTDPKAVVFEAWLASNEAMANFMQARFGNDDSEWRLFQLAFIIANVPALASRIPAFKDFYVPTRDDSVTLLYFATGGGKSEAFFGLLAFNLLLDRLRGKQKGVTAMLRYPLRLLTIQQAQRCAKVLAQAELVRRKYHYPGDAFAIGFWVGSGGSPNRHSAKGVSHIPTIETTAADTVAESQLRENNPKYSAAYRAWNKIPSCPFCGKPTALRLFPALGGTLAHVCTSIECQSNEGSWKPLPFLICDEDIYDFAPSVLLGTVDKLALIGHSAPTIRRILGMLGMAPWRAPATGRLKVPTHQELQKGYAACGFEPLNPAYDSGATHFFDPFPSLLIQDEAHLLDESLGTFAGLFESTLDTVFTYLARSLTKIVVTDASGQYRRAKVIAASATVSEPERQMQHLYQRKIPASQFPHPGPSLYESFYAAPAEPDTSETERQHLAEVEQRAKQARIYCAFMTNGKPHTATSIAVLSGFHLCISKLFESLVNGDEAMQEYARTLLSEHVSQGVLQELHQEALRTASIGALATVVDLHRIALTYVTNKKGGDQIMAAELEETRKRHLNMGVALGSLDTRLITGSVEQGEIQEVVRLAQERDKPNTPFTPLSQVLRSVIATSAISHGVDVEEFNSMFFAGMPSDIAEYIQASSRVGRTHIGFSILIPTPQRRRDRYIVEVFDIFHRFLERMVQPAAIDRWAEKAVERVYPSLFQAYLTGVLPSKEVIDRPEAQKGAATDFTYIPNITQAFHTRGTSFVQAINGFIELAIGLKDGYCPEGEDHYRKMIDDKTRWLLAQWASSSMYGNGPLKAYFDGQSDPMKKPMTSLRDVDQGGEIRVARRDARGNRLSHDEVLVVMDLIRNGVAETNDEEA